MADSNVPACRGYSLPAEWERHEATWITWPHQRRDWPGKFSTIPWVYAEIVRALAPGETVRIIAHSPEVEARARRVLARAGVDPGAVEFFPFPTNRGWNRDCGPIFLRRTNLCQGLAIAGFRFNAWAKYRDSALDDQVAARAAKALGLPLLPISMRGRGVVLEGGAVDVNGAGAAFTTEECLLDPAVQVRNPGFTREDYEEALREILGASQVIWLGRGIAGDDTHGHVDDLCRFVNRTTAVLCREEDPADANHRPLAENRERLRGVSMAGGARLEVVDLPMPGPLFFDGRRLPASYANFYIGNEVLLVPTFNDPRDRKALGILADLFPGRRVVGIHAVDLVWGLGTIHCLTQQQPAALPPPA